MLEPPVFKGHTVLVTGGTGTFGKAFVHQALDHGAYEVRVYSRDELKQSEMEQELNDSRVKFIVGDVRDLSRLTEACKQVEIVVHAAAMKRLETCEKDPQEAVKTNVLGSINVINACLATGVDCAISLSSDKAVCPVNTYGKTKALMESVWIQSNAGLGRSHETKFSVVRYGNVLGSRGSVVDIFRMQAKQGMVRVTNGQMTRFFMPVNYATDLVEFAVREQRAGSIFIPFLKATSISSLVAAVAEGVPVKVVGPRPGEKVHEDIATQKEMARASLYKGVVVVDPEYCTWSYRFGSYDPFVFPLRSCDAEQMSPVELKGLLLVADACRTFRV